MDYKAILNLMKEMNQTELTKLEIEAEGLRISMEKGGCVQSIAMPSPVVMPQPTMPSPTISVTAAPVPATIAEAVTENAPVAVDGKKQLSPMVGTYYAQPSPDKPAFVKVGDKVKKGQTLCIIEAMKLMNEIESEFDGEIVDILVKNEQMVEFGQPLFVIK